MNKKYIKRNVLQESLSGGSHIVISLYKSVTDVVQAAVVCTTTIEHTFVYLSIWHRSTDPVEAEVYALSLNSGMFL